jgi:Uma2 family endonuclease
MATRSKTRYTYADLERFPEDNLRREIIDGDLIVTAAPSTRHQRAVIEIAAALLAYRNEHGGDVFPTPTDVFFSDINVVEPDVLFVRADHTKRVEEKFVRSAPDVVVEVSSPSTRRLELVRKRELYERFGVAEYWYVDLQADRIEVYRLEAGHYGTPLLLLRGDRLASHQLPGFEIDVDSVLGRAPDTHGEM